MAFLLPEVAEAAVETGVGREVLGEVEKGGIKLFHKAEDIFMDGDGGSTSGTESQGDDKEDGNDTSDAPGGGTADSPDKNSGQQNPGDDATDAQPNQGTADSNDDTSGQ